MSDQELRRELTLRDLVLAQLLIVVGTPSFGPAAKLGAAQAVVWIAGIIFFNLPLATVVRHLNRQAPLEGGLYQWAKRAYGETAGFMTAWNTFLFFTFFTSLVGLSVSTAFRYAMHVSLSVIGSAAVVLATIALLSILGLRVGKRVYNTAIIVFLIIIAMLVIAAGRRLFVRPELPPPTLFNIVIFTKMVVYSLGGFEALAILAGETRDPERAIGRSTIIAVPLIAIIYVSGTGAILSFVPQTKIDLINPVAQAFSIAFPALAVGAILLILLHDLATLSVAFAANSRLPMIAGWDEILPAWFTKLHPTRKTPVNSILFIAVVAFLIGLIGVIGVGQQEGFQILQSAAGVLFALTYVVMFSIPLLKPAPAIVRVAAASGLIVTVAFILFSIFPIVDVVSPARYAAKIALTVLIANAAGFLIVRRR